MELIKKVYAQHSTLCVLSGLGLGLFLYKRYKSKLRIFLFGNQRLQEIILVDSKSACDNVIHNHFRHHTVLGLDCEWVTIGSHRENVSLLQLASPNGVCALFRLTKLYQFDIFTQSYRLPQSLELILLDDDIIKVGVAIDNDSKYLLDDYDVQIRSWLDLRYLAMESGVEGRGLAYLAKETLGIELEKKFDVRVSNWDADILNLKQIDYAAQDAYVALSIFTYFAALKLKLIDVLFHSREDNYKFYLENFYSYLNVSFKYKSSGNATFKLESASEHCRKRNYSTNNQSHLEQPWKGFRPGKLFDNCQLLDTYGRVLSTCDRKKAQWYLDKDLATLEKEDPMTVRLRFQPSGFDYEDCKYYAEEKLNQCVVCGNQNTRILIRKYIVPYEYRKQFPVRLKSRRCHDILLMCFNCHARSNKADLNLRRKLAFQCSAPLDPNVSKKTADVRQIQKVRNAARALLHHIDTIPLHRQQELRNIILDHYDVDQVTPSLLCEAAMLDETIEHGNYVPHAKLVVQSYQPDLDKFEELWRQHFLDTMRPKYMPKHWSVHHNAYRQISQDNM